MYISIDKDRCTICGKCVRACPADVLEIWGDTSKVMRPELCTSCGHCAAICPEDAIECTDAPAKRRFSVQEPGRPYTPSEWRGELQSLLRNKRSMRKLKRDPLPSEVIRDLIYYGEKAPSAKNFRERRYYVITSRKDIDALEEQVVHSFKRLTGLLNPVTLGMVSLASKDAKETLTELKAGFINIQLHYRLRPAFPQNPREVSRRAEGFFYLRRFNFRISEALLPEGDYQDRPRGCVEGIRRKTGAGQESCRPKTRNRSGKG